MAIAGVHGGALRASARVEAFGFDAVGKAPGVSGLSGDMQGDGNGLAVTFDKAAPVRIDWPHGFRDAHVVTLQGALSGWREDAGWRVATPALRIAGAAYGAAWPRPWVEGDARARSISPSGSTMQVVTANRFGPARAPAAASAALRGHSCRDRARRPRAVIGDLETAIPTDRRRFRAGRGRRRASSTTRLAAGERACRPTAIRQHGFSVAGSRPSPLSTPASTAHRRFPRSVF